MSQTMVEALMDRWINDRDFRAAVRDNLRHALGGDGEKLTEAEFITVQRMFRTLAKGAAPPNLRAEPAQPD